MRRCLLVLAVLLPPVALADDLPVLRRANAVLLSPAVNFGFLGSTPGGGFAVMYQRVLGARVSFTAGLGLSAGRNRMTYSSNDDGVFSPVDFRSFGVSLQPGVRIFLVENAPSGLWVGPRLEGGYGSSSVEFGSFTSRSRDAFIGGSALVGFSHVFPKGFLLEGVAGMTARYSRNHTTSDVVDPSLLPLSAAQSAVSLATVLELGVGWAF